MNMTDFYQLADYKIYQQIKKEWTDNLSNRQIDTLHDIQDINDKLEELEEQLLLLYVLCPRARQIHEHKNYHSLTQKSQVYTELLQDMKQLCLYVSYCTHADPENLKELCDKLLTLYGQTVLSLEKLLYTTYRYFKRIPFTQGFYTNHACEEHFKNCIYAVTTRDHLSIYFVDVTCLFNQLRRTIVFY